jgi:Flp pilus assembly protein TadG
MSRAKRRIEAGVVLVEAALTLLVLFIVLFAIMEAGRFFQVQEMISNAAREGARLAVSPLTQSTTMPSDDEITSKVQTYLDAASITGATVTVDRYVRLSDGVAISSPCNAPCGTRVSVQAPYQIATLSMFTSLSMNLKGKALMRNETSP